MRNPTRRAALLGAAGLLAACDTITDTADSLFGESKSVPSGERLPVLSDVRPVQVDEGPRVPVTLPAPQNRTDWPLAGGGLSHAGGNPALGSPLGEAWRVSVGTGSSYRRRLVAPPVSDGRLIFVVDAAGEVSAVEAATGRRAWRFDTTPKGADEIELGGGLGVAGGVLYCVTAQAEAIALNPDDGAVKWRVKLPAPARGAPSIAGGRLFVPTIENQVVALNAADGERAWAYRGQPVTAMAMGLPAPAVDGDTVIVGLASGEVAAINARDGRAVWTEAVGIGRGTSLADISGVSGLPVLDRGRVFVTAQGGATVSLDQRSGRRLWDREVASARTPWVAGDWLFVTSAGMELVCLNANDGRIRWLRNLPRYQNEQRRRDPITWGGPFVAGGRVMVCGNNGEMLEISAADGEPISRIKLPGAALLAPAIFGGTLYLLTENASLVAIRGG